MAPREITDFTGFRTSIRQLFEVLQNAYDKDKMQEVLQNDEKFSNVDRETVEAINLFAGTDIDIDEKEEVIDMCKAWEEQKNEGREEGRELGERQKIISLIVKKLQKDKSVAEIADDLEEKEEVIAPIYEAALSMKPGTWNEAPCAVAKNIMTKHHSSATISLKREFTKEDKLIPGITITVYLGSEGDNRLYRIQNLNQAAFRGITECL